MDIIQAIIIGLVQGLTEFLPVSSSAHLIFIQHFLGVAEPSLAFDVLLHLGTVVAVVVYFWKDILQMILAFFESLVDLVKGIFLSEIHKDQYKNLTFQGIDSHHQFYLSCRFFEQLNTPLVHAILNDDNVVDGCAVDTTLLLDKSFGLIISNRFCRNMFRECTMRKVS